MSGSRTVRWLVIGVVALTSACTPGAAEVARGGRATPATTTVTATPDPAVTASPTLTARPRDEVGTAAGDYPSRTDLGEVGAVATCGHLGDEFCQDSNGNVWPDFVEESLGRDPLVDGCAQSGCAPGGVGDFLASLAGNTLMILDASGSMAGDAGGQAKMDAAKAAVAAHVAGTPAFIDTGLMVYGHRGDNSDAGRAESCAGIETFAPMGQLDHTTVDATVGQFQATGWTPIAAALDAALPLLEDAAAADAAEGIEGATSRIVVISDGLETCGGDPVASAAALSASGIEVVVDVIGFDIAEGDRAALAEVAAVTGGQYVDARTGADIYGILDAYNAQYDDLVERVQCQYEARAQLSQCHFDLRLEAGDAVRALADEEDDRARASFLNAWAVAAAQASDDAYDAQVEVLEARLDQLVADRQEALERRSAARDSIVGGRRDKVVRTVASRCPFTDERATST